MSLLVCDSWGWSYSECRYGLVKSAENRHSTQQRGWLSGWLTGVFEEDLVHVRGGVLEELVVRVEDDDGDLAVAQHAEFIGLLHKAELALGERHLSIALVADARNRDLFPAHVDCRYLCRRRAGR